MRKNEVYWWAAAPLATPEQKPVPPSADVAIVAAGYTGLGAAIRLAGPGARSRSSTRYTRAKARRPATSASQAAATEKQTLDHQRTAQSSRSGSTAQSTAS